MISDETIAAVRDRVDIVALIGQNVALQRRGRRFIGLCPFHKEKTPSFSVNPERGFYYCFGCKASGGAFDYLMQLDGMTFPEAVTALAEQHGVPIEDETTPAERRQSQQRKQEREQLYGIMRMAADFYERQLEVSGHPLAVLARAELAKRGIGYGAGHEQVDAALRAFHVGYAPYGWDGLKHFLVQQEVSLEMAQRLGLLATRRGGGFYDAFRHRLMFAVSDKTGRVVAFSGRALAEPSEE